MIEVKRKPNESVSSMLRRFSQLLQWDGKLERVKKMRFREKAKSKACRKKQALLRKAFREKKEYFKKIGLLK